ncbi:MAG TPA: GNAT family N-acetyltransferase [Acidimicrobiales bacterium]|nr:GNAT family N-acetyltransferase [Acidimicrobiales bacterium]
MIRPRTSDDLDDCAAIADEVHDVDGYPSFLGDDTLLSFITPTDALGAWVAIDDDRLVGHVVLRTRSAPASVTLAARTLGVGPEQLGFVARLLVAPTARRRGVARRLLERVIDEAHQRGLHAVLDVVTRDLAAIALYDASGWRRLGEHTMTLRGGASLDLLVYAAP